MVIPPNVQDFWKAFVAQSCTISKERFYEAFAFGDSKELANSLADLVIRDVKRATAGSLWAFEVESKVLPKPGDLSVVTDWDGNPLCIIETVGVEIVPFEQVSAEFAAAEGEGDGSLECWRQGHTSYFYRECARIGRTFSVTMPVVCERFTVVFKSSAPRQPNWSFNRSANGWPAWPCGCLGSSSAARRSRQPVVARSTLR